MEFSSTVSPRVFKAIQNVDVEELSKCTPKEIRPILPCLVRMSLISPLDNTRECAEGRKEILTLLSGIELVNSIVALLSIDFHALESDVKKEQQLRQKLGSSQTDSVLVQSLQNGLALEFERSDSTRRLRLVLSELLLISSQLHEQQRGQEFTLRRSDLFDNAVYIEEICDVICIALAELPAVLNVLDIVETLLHVRHGPEIICWVVANSPDCFREVCTSLIANGERQEEDNVGGKIRMQALSMLCHMNPIQALAIRAKCVELCRMPALAIILSLEHSGRSMGTDAGGDMVAFVSGLLLGNDQQVRNWFALFVRNGQKRKGESHAALQLLRDELLRRLQTVVLFSMDQQLPDSCVVQASALLRLYCALRGIAGIKFQEEEVSLIVQLLTSHPPPSPAGVRFVSLGLCMLIACPSLIGQQEHEKRSIEWVQWLVREEAYFESASGVTASFGEMLLLMAIHFHSQQLSAICELVCSTLGMKVPIRPNNMTRMKQIFTQEIFTEQVVTSHAVKVPVTANLNANITGFLPIHCIHQLLKSRAFTKHRVPIKNWIYRQICSSVPPLHPVLPALVEVYVNSILVPSTKAPQEHTNQPMEEDEIRRVFQNSVFGGQFDSKNKSDQEKMEQDCEVDISTPSLTSQLLLLYYLLLYEDVRLNNAHTHTASGRKVKRYSTEFLSELPIKYLLQQAQKDQQSYAGLFSPLLRLLATHFPHLSLVGDWMDEERTAVVAGRRERVVVSESTIREAFSHITTCPSRVGRLLHQLLAMPATDVWPFAEIIIDHFRALLDEKVPRYIKELYKRVWLQLNTVLPRCLWVMSINALIHHSTMLQHVFLRQESIVLDPLQVLRCDVAVFRCASVLSVVLRVLEASLAASRSQLARHLQDKPLTERLGQLASESEREELRSALVAAQESTAVQILLESCLMTEEDKTHPGQMWALREVRSLVCSYLHQVFIADPGLAKLVHFQGYPRELLPVTVPGIPSMHICLDFIPELMSQPSLEKQIFAVDLVSHLAVQYALPKSLSVARLAINTLSTLLGVLPSESRIELFVPIMPALVRICKAFPPLVDDVMSLLMQLGRICTSRDSLSATKDSYDEKDVVCANSKLCHLIQDTFSEILREAVLKVKIY
ncbi:integrator complex subunit 2 [Anabrus simplex]|uniref:integrator complex subunit 2 n=1 Tax=Anabrus simplex TaxID=316456 RepID=UPI0034DCDF11